MMNRNHSTKFAAIAGAVALLAGIGHVSAQSADALIDKLVDKGILTVKEANALREDADKNFNTALAVKTGMPDWLSGYKFYGDIRGRYESFYYDYNPGVDRQRFRYRLRVGAAATLFDNFEAGFRLTSSEAANGGSGGDPISGNTTLQDNGSKKFIYIDLAYLKWSPLNNANWAASVTLGKMENPFLFSDMVFDADYTPEGAAVQLAYNFNSQHALKLNAGIFAVDEIGGSSSDPMFMGAQLRFDSTWNSKWQSSFGVAALNLANDQFLNASRGAALGGAGGTNFTGTTTWTVPNQNGGNLRSPLTGFTGSGGNLLNHYNPIVLDAAVTYTLDKFPLYNGPFPIRFGGDFMHNPAAASQNSAYSVGIMLGKSGKKGLWDLSYRYKYLEGDAWYEEFVDSDFGAVYRTASARSAGSTGYVSGTNVKGHIVKLSYSPYNCFTLGVTGFLTELIQPNPASARSDAVRLQIDGTLKF